MEEPKVRPDLQIPKGYENVLHTATLRERVLERDARVLERQSGITDTTIISLEELFLAHECLEDVTKTFEEISRKAKNRADEVLSENASEIPTAQNLVKEGASRTNRAIEREPKRLRDRLRKIGLSHEIMEEDNKNRRDYAYEVYRDKWYFDNDVIAAKKDFRN